MSVLFSPSDRELLSRPHVARNWFASLDLPSGIAYLHGGVGTVEMGGFTWRGVTDPIGGQILSIGQVEEPVFGQAAAITLVLNGANKAFIQSVHATAREIEGRSAEIYWAAFDQETQQPLTTLKRLFPRGRMTSPTVQWRGIGRRVVTLTIENIWSTQNFAPGGRWNSAGQHQHYEGDLGLDFVGVRLPENWQ